MKPAGIDLVRDGLPDEVLAANGGGRALFGALVSSAMWAHQRGMSEAEWCGLLDEPRSALGRQARTRRNGRAEAPKRTRDRLARAWASAADKVAASPRWTADEARRRARETAQAARDLAADADNDLTQSERVLLDAVAKIADDRGSDRLTLPRALLLGASGLGLTAFRTAQRRLDERGLLTLDEVGRPYEKGRPKRANVYRLTCLPNPESGVVVPPALSSGAPKPSDPGAPAPVSGAPTETKETSRMLPSLSALTPEEEAAVLRLLAEMRAPTPTLCQITREHGAHEYGPMTSGGRLAHRCPGNVRHLRAVDEREAR